MKKDSTKNSAPLAPTSSSASNATGAKPAKVAAPLKGKLMKKTGNAKGGTNPYQQAKPSRTEKYPTGGARYSRQLPEDSCIRSVIYPGKWAYHCFCCKPCKA